MGILENAGAQHLHGTFVFIYSGARWSPASIFKGERNEIQSFDRNLVPDFVLFLLWLVDAGYGDPGHYPGFAGTRRCDIYVDRQVKTIQKTASCVRGCFFIVIRYVNFPLERSTFKRYNVRPGIIFQRLPGNISVPSQT